MALVSDSNYIPKATEYKWRVCSAYIKGIGRRSIEANDLCRQICISMLEMLDEQFHTYAVTIESLLKDYTTDWLIKMHEANSKREYETAKIGYGFCLEVETACGIEENEDCDAILDACTIVKKWRD